MKKVTGLMVYYYHVCERKLWYFAHDLNMEHNSEIVGMGKLLDETSYSRETKHILIDESINIDFIQDWKIVHEVKKSKIVEEASIWQTKYYMMILKDNGLEVEKGIIDFPLLRSREIVELREEDIIYLREVIEKISSIINCKEVPNLVEKKICKKCSYYEYCYI
ncbi:CRISPR-associated protein Cas4 [Peptoniphilus indolicus]|uniref:CRISPR-associated exonuclease Cas4 n=2 Tax=Peptoniphilus indolicus TaxID=33030 RepID=G4D316_9FIRM|nr:CRISPR-associated protein Cas4 [Peptoniphilus indolicus]EGY80086.1 CRISPR-associated protein cas4 [Peptoniphilus indolicus ATCC 29427]SUB75123.1 CRISPR-associated protein Cas4 [Peptoniphilus indolicus]